MSTAVAIYHGRFGRATLYRLNRPMTTHAHREGHLIFLVSGTASCTNVHGRPCPLTRGHGAAVNPWEPHDFVPGDQNGGSLFLVLYIRPTWFLDFERGACTGLRFARNRILMTRRVRRPVDRVVTMLAEGAASDIFDGLLFELTHECFDQTWRTHPAGMPVRARRFTDYRVRKSARLMSERLGSEIDLDAIAREAGLSRPHFYRLFKTETGLTPNLFLNTLRMEKAVTSLTESADSVANIGFDLGFASQSSFSRFFAANVGMAPSDYRRAAQRLDG
jgi:AraC-like DNA-binding protein